MSDFTQLPVKDGFKGCFDYTNYNGGDTWLNQYADGSGINFNMSNAVKNEEYILFPELQGMCYLIDDIGNNFTLYSILKCDHSNSAQTAKYLVWLISALGASVNYRIYLYQDPGATDYFGVLSGSGDSNNRVNFNNVNFYDYCVAAISVCNGQQKVYINGELKWTGTNKINYSIDEIGVNLNASGYGGAVPTISSNNTANVYVKYIGYATNNHNEIQIQQNSDWLLEQYGLKIPEKNSRLAGTDAVAIAYAIARNQESAAALRQLKKAYQDGMLDGDGDTTPTYETDDTDPIIETDPENNGDHGQTNDGTVVDLSKGIMAIYENPDDPTDTVTVEIKMMHDKDKVGSNYLYKGYILVKVYKSNGEEIGTNQHTFLTWQGDQMYHLWKYETMSYYFIKYECHFGSKKGYVYGYTVNQDGKTSGVSGPVWTLPDGYVYVGCKNI